MNEEEDFAPWTREDKDTIEKGSTIAQSIFLEAKSCIGGGKFENFSESNVKS